MFSFCTEKHIFIGVNEKNWRKLFSCFAQAKWLYFLTRKWFKLLSCWLKEYMQQKECQSPIFWRLTLFFAFKSSNSLYFDDIQVLGCLGHCNIYRNGTAYKFCCYFDNSVYWIINKRNKICSSCFQKISANDFLTHSGHIFRLPPLSVPTDKISIGILLFSMNCVMIKAVSNERLEQKRSNTQRDDDEKIRCWMISYRSNIRIFWNTAVSVCMVIFTLHRTAHRRCSCCFTGRSIRLTWQKISARGFTVRLTGWWKPIYVKILPGGDGCRAGNGWFSGHSGKYVWCFEPTITPYEHKKCDQQTILL